MPQSSTKVLVQNNNIKIYRHLKQFQICNSRLEGEGVLYSSHTFIYTLCGITAIAFLLFRFKLRLPNGCVFDKAKCVAYTTSFPFASLGGSCYYKDMGFRKQSQSQESYSDANSSGKRRVDV